MRPRQLVIPLCLVLLGRVCGSAMALPTITNLALQSEKRLSRTVFEYTYRITIRNDATARTEVVASITTVGKGTSVVKGVVAVGTLAPNQEVGPNDTITLRHDRLLPFSSSAIVWSVTGKDVPVAGDLIADVTPLDIATTRNRPRLLVSFSEGGVGIDPTHTKLVVNGTDVTAQAEVTPLTVTYTPPAPLADGAQTATVTVMDRAGQVSSRTWQFTVLTPPPAPPPTSGERGVLEPSVVIVPTD